MKKLFITLLILLVVVGGGAFALITNINTIVEKAVNTYGPKMTGTSVHLGQASLSLFSGNETLKDFTLGNPEGFTGEYALKVGEISVSLDPQTIMEDVIHIQSVFIDSPDIVYEWKDSKTNFDTIINNITQATKSNSAASKKPASTEKQDDTTETQKKVIIDELIIRNAKAQVVVPKLNKTLAINLPEIKITDIGRDGQGKSLAETASLVLTSVSKQVYSAVKTDFDNISSFLKREDLKNEIQEIVNEQSEAVKKGFEGLKNLFKK